MNLLYYTNFVQKLDYLHSTLNNPTPSFIADDETKLFQTQLATIARSQVTGSSFCPVALWEGFGFAIASFL